VVAARELLEAEGAEAVTMRRLADRLGIRAASLYNHFPDKEALETAIIASTLAEVRDVLASALVAAAPGDELDRLAVAYRGYALAHPHLYRLATGRPLPRERLPQGLEASAAAPLLEAAGDEHRARAVWAFAHGLVDLELAGRFPPGADVERAWRVGIEAFGKHR
jgi:AcrR family transcriptional regulator